MNTSNNTTCEHKKTVKALAALVATLMLILLFAVPALAASAKVSAVLQQLYVLQNADINPEWLPDIRAQEHSVQALLDLYEQCSEKEQAEFTTEQNKILRAFFTALYTVQGKEISKVNDLFGGGVASSSSSSASSSKPASSANSESKAASSSSTSSSTLVSSSSAVSSIPAESTASIVSSEAIASEASSANLAIVTDNTNAFPPQVFKSSGISSILGNRGLASGLLMMLGFCIFLLIVRFLAAMRSAGKVPVRDSAAATRAQELFGELYAMADSTGYSKTDEPTGPVKPAPPLKKANRKPRGTKQDITSGESVQNSSPSDESDLEYKETNTDEKQALSIQKVDEFDSHAAQFMSKTKTQDNVPEPQLQKTPDHAPAMNEHNNTSDAPAVQSRERPRFERPPTPVQNSNQPSPAIVATNRPPPRTGRPNKMPFIQSNDDDID